MKRRFACAVAACVIATLSAAGAILPAAGSADHGWLALPPSDTRRASGLYHFPASIEPGGVRVGPRLGAPPTHLAAGAGRLLIVYDEIASPPPAPPVTTNEMAPVRRAPLQRRVQSITVAPGVSPGYFDYQPANRAPQSLPSLPTWGRLDGVTLAADTPLALLAPSPAAPGEATAPSLLALRGREWVECRLPADLRSGERLLLLSGGFELVLAQRSADAVTVWRSPVAPARSPTDRSPPELNWTSESLALPEGVDAFLLAAGQIIGADVDAPGEVRLWALRGSGAVAIDGATDVAGDLAILPVGERIYVAWTGSEKEPRLHVAAISALTGLTLYAGPAVADPIVSGRELHTLGLMLGFVLLTIMIFALRPEAAPRREIVLPEGWSIAGPARRAAAVAVDLLPGLIVGAMAFDVRPGDMLNAALLSPDMIVRDAAATLFAVAVTIVHSAAGEWTLGQTIGKRLLGLRVVTARGRPTLWQAVARASLVYLCPPLALFVFLDLQARHPADVLTQSLVIRRAPEPRAPDGSQD